jgi:hypothetical protein
MWRGVYWMDLSAGWQVRNKSCGDGAILGTSSRLMRAVSYLCGMGSMRARGGLLGRIGVAFVVWVLGFCGIGSVSVLAESFTPSFSFKTCSNPSGVAVDSSTGDMYVLCRGERRVEKFDSEGKLLLVFDGSATKAKGFGAENIGLAVDNSAEPGDPSKGDVYVADREHNVVDRFGAGGEFLGELTGIAEPRGVAVDSRGDVYVAQNEPAAVLKFGPSGESLCTIEAGQVTRPASIAVGSGGELYVVNLFSNLVRLSFKAGCEVESVAGIDSQKATAVTVDPAGNVYVVDEFATRLVEYNSAGKLVEFGAELVAGSESEGLAFSPFTEDLYLSDLVDNDVHVFAPVGGPLPPVVEKCSAVTLTPVDTAVRCTVVPNAVGAEWHVEFHAAAGGPLNVESSHMLNSSSISSVEQDLSGLRPQTDYLFTLVATNSNTPAKGEAEGKFTTPPAVNGVSGCSASEVINDSATLHASLEPELAGELPAKYLFQYGASTHERTIENPGKANVSEAITGLTPHTTYHCRLVASDQYGETQSNQASEFTTSGPPIVTEETFSAVGTTSAMVSAQVNPEGLPGQQLPATYQFEYGTTTAYGRTTSPVTLAPGQGPVAAPAQLPGLEANTEYHFRVTTTDADGTTHGPDTTFITYPTTSLTLPDNRAYEMVTPPDDNNANVYVPAATETYTEAEGVQTNLPFQASADGNAVAYVGDPASEGNGNAGLAGGNEFLARRSTPGEWEQQDIQPTGHNTPIYQAFSPDLSIGILNSCDPTPLMTGAPGDGYSVLYTQTFSNGSYHPFFTTTPRDQSAEDFGAFGVTSYFHPCHTGGILFAAAYAGASADFGHLLFEVNGALTGNASDSGNTNNLYDSIAGHVYLVNVLPDGKADANATFGALPVIAGQIPNFSHVISSDGSRIFWTDLNSGEVYVRENGMGSKAQSVAVSKGPARFWTATPDGRYAFYTEGVGLWRFDVESGQRTELTPGVGVQGVVGTSEDGRYVYYVAEDGLYLYHAGTRTFITPLDNKDNKLYGGEIGAGDWRPGLGQRTAEVTPNGGSVVFMSKLSLTGYDNRGLAEVYVYGAQSGVLACVSCDPNGEPPGEGPSARNEGLAGFVPISHSNTYVPRWVSADGDRVFFDSTQSLVSQDENGKQDAYEWERAGSGSCPVGAPGGGCVYLLSGGSSATASWLLDASESGDDVFIITRARLLAQDRNENYDVYDVRVGGVSGLPGGSGCVEAGCQGVPAAAPVFGAPASGTFEGLGNFLSGTLVSPEPPPGKVVLTRAQKLAKALTACRKDRARHKRMVCEVRARRRYGVAVRARKTARRVVR